MRMPGSRDCFLLTWGVSVIFGEPGISGVLAMPWGICLFHFTVQSLNNSQAPYGPGKMLFDVGSRQLPGAHENFEFTQR